MTDRKALESKITVMHPELSKTQVKLVATKVKKQLETNGKMGAGLFTNIVSSVKSAAKKALPTLITAASNVVQNKVLDKVAPSKEGCKDRNPNWEYTPKSGESHQVYVTKEGCRYTSKFSGPNTHVVEDLKELLSKNNNNISQAVDPKNFTSEIDRTALTHDLRYLLSGGDPKLVREADNKFISKLNSIQDNNKIAPLAAMIAKTKGEDAGLVKVYSGDEKASQEDLDLMQKVLDHMEMQGFGKNRPIRGGKRSEARDAEQGVRGSGKPPSKWIVHVKNYAKEHKIPYKEAMGKAKSSYKP